jgi:hypothetical protein
MRKKNNKKDVRSKKKEMFKDVKEKIERIEKK